MLKAEFVSYLPTVMEQLLHDAAKSVDMQVVTAKEAELENRDDEEGKAGSAHPELSKMTLTIKGVEAPIQISMNTAALENKVSAL